MAFDIQSEKAFARGAPPKRPCKVGTAFSLVELLVTMAVIILLISLCGMGINQILQSSRMEQSGRMIVDEINLARQIAASRNLNVEIRFIGRIRDASVNSTPVFHALQSGLIKKDEEFAAVSGITALPEGIIFASDPKLSSLIGTLAQSSHINPSYSYTSVVLRPTGMMDADSTLGLNAAWFVTAIHERDAGKNIEAIHDFITVQIDPWTSRPKLYRP